MTYCVAVWEGERPKNGEQALAIFEDLHDRYVGTNGPANQRIVDYVAALTARYPDLTELSDDEVDDSPWAAGPFDLDATGPLFYFALRYGSVEEVLPFIVETARSHGLVCFDPQRVQVL